MCLKRCLCKFSYIFLDWQISRVNFIMSGNDGQNLFDLSKNAINQLEKPELVKRILELKGRVTVDLDIRDSCDEIKNLPETVSRLLDKHEQLNSGLLICQKVKSCQT